MTQPAQTEDFFLQLGPFQGITDVWYRQAFQKYFSGIDQFFTPFFSGIHKENSKNLRVAEIDPLYNPAKNLVPQLLSNDAKEVLRFARQVKAMGYNEINLNMGCPYPIVANKKRGSGILPYPELVKQIVDQVSEAAVLNYSIKCRLGYISKDEIDKLIPLFNQAGLSELIVHARIGKQLYKGLPDWEKFGLIRHEIIPALSYNGDIFSVEAFRKISSQYPGINRWMLGRGLLANPFLAMDIKQPDLIVNTEERLQTVRLFVQELYYLRRKQSNDNLSTLGRMKELWSYLRHSFSHQQEVWRLIKKTGSFEAYENAVETVFNNYAWMRNSTYGEEPS
jgi:tRNA-dihydrouridine synthase